jgi:hypothetical protein
VKGVSAFFFFRKDRFMAQKLVSVQEIAETLSVPTSWVYSRTPIKGVGGIPHINVGKYVRFDVCGGNPPL